MKFPAGALVAVFAMILVQSSIVKQIAPVDRGQIAAYAMLFGFAQESIARSH